MKWCQLDWDFQEMGSKTTDLTELLRAPFSNCFFFRKGLHGQPKPGAGRQVRDVKGAGEDHLLLVSEEQQQAIQTSARLLRILRSFPGGPLLKKRIHET